MRISDWSSDVCSSDLLARPTIISDGQFTPDGKTLTLSLEDADAADFAAALRRGRSAFDPHPANAARPPAQTHGMTVAIPPPAKAIGPPKVDGPGDDKRPLVVIHEGTGGHDTGALNKDLGTRDTENGRT